MHNRIKLLLIFFSCFLAGFDGTAQINPCLASSTFKIVVLGSSTAAGSGVSTSDSAWVNRYRTYVESINPANEVINLAVGGYNTYRIMPTGYTPPASRPNPDISRNITAALAENPQAIIVNMPSNDVGANYTYEEQMSNLDTIVQIANAAAVPIWICTTQPRNFSTAQAQLQWDLKDSILALFSPHAIDFWTSFALPNHLVDPIYDSGDGIHLNDAAHAIMEDRVINANILEQIYVTGVNPDPGLISIDIENLSACGDSNTVFNIGMINFGPNDSVPTSISFELNHSILGVLESATSNFPNGLASCDPDTLQITSNTFAAGEYTFTAIISSATNTESWNDTLTVQFSTAGHPTGIANNDTLCASDFALLSVTSSPQDTVIWYTDMTSPIPIAYGNSFLTPVVNTSTDWFAEVVRGNLFYSDNIFSSNLSNINFNGVMFDLIGHETIEIDSFDVKINTLGSQSIEIYKKVGTHIGFELDPASWTLLEVVTVDVLDSDIQTHVPFQSFSMSADDTVGIYLRMANSSSNLSYMNSGSPLTRSTNELTMYTGSSVNNSYTTSYFPRDWNGRVYYHHGERLQGDCSTGRFPVSALINDVTFETVQDTIIDILDTLTLASTAGMSSYLWSDGSTASTMDFIASQYGPGIHFVTVSAYDSLNCFHLDTVIVGVADLVSLNEHTLDLSIFPNPTTGILQLSSSEIDEVELFTLSGQKIGELIPTNGKIDISQFPSGFYLLKLRSQHGTKVLKILKANP